MSQHTYSAFISYRHQSPDMEIAARLHKQIETYTIPAGIRQQSGKKRMGKVFRDQEELPLSADLGKDIEEALDNSEWLIAICTPAYLESRWCMREMEYFIQKNGRERVLAVLAAGEPEDSFPSCLRFSTDEKGRSTEIEPLAADVRGSSVAESLRKLGREKLRILAPMLGTTFDGLVQRHRRRRMRNALLAACFSVLLLSGFLAYALTQNAKIQAERTYAAQNQCDLLIEKSLYHTADYRTRDARRYAFQALQVSETLEGYSAERAEDALAASCYAGDFFIETAMDSLGIYETLHGFSPDGQSVVTVASRSEIICMDAQTGEQRWIAVPSRTEITALSWNEDGTLLAACAPYESAFYILDTQDGKTKYKADFGYAFASTAVFRGEKVLVAMDKGIFLWDPKSNETTPIAEPEGNYMYTTSRLSSSGDFLLWSSNIDGGKLLAVNIRTLEVFDYHSTDRRMMSDYNISPDGTRAFISHFKQLSVIDLAEKKTLWSVETAEGNSSPTPTSVWVGNRLLTNGEVYDSQTGQALYKLDDTCFGFSADEQYFIGQKGLYAIEDGTLYCTAPGMLLAADKSGRHLLYRSGYQVYRAAAPGKGSQIEIERYTGTLTNIPDWTEPSGHIALSDLFSVTPQSVQSHAARTLISPNLRYVVMINYDSNIKIFDLSKSNEPQYRLYSFSMGDITEVADASFSADSRYVAFVGGGGMSNIAVYELETGKLQRFWKDQFYKKALLGVKFNKEGNLIMAMDFRKKEFRIYSLTNGLMLYVMNATKPVIDWGFDDTTGDGILLYEDGSALAADIFISSEELRDYALAVELP
ncbi:MAG: TIR domain-containing protein [Christensenellales bacterium]|nr:TIR domain-containing protein [Clostridiales bacterium]